MTQPLLLDLVDRVLTRESLEIEFKLAQGGLPRSLWETVSAFANTSGGWIILGVDGEQDPPQIVGVPNASTRLDEFYSLINDPKKISHRACSPTDTEIETIEGKDVVVIRIPAAPLKGRPVYIHDHPFHGTYVRGNTGDFHCSRNDVLRMMREASDSTADSTILDHFGLADLDQKSLRGYRQRFQNENPASPFNALDDLDFLKAIDALREDPQSGRSGLTVAGLLLLGTSQSIRQWRTRHLIDYRLVSDDDRWDYRWDDRVLCEGNLLEAFDTIYPRLTAELPIPFRLQGPIRAGESPIHVALREALVNLLVHADYSETRASLIVRFSQGYSFRNPGNSRVPIRELGQRPESDPRNPILVRMMRFIGLADEAGSGMAKIFRAWRESQLVPPSIRVDSERYEFQILMPYINLLADDDRSWLGTLSSDWSEAEQMALLHARHEGYVDNVSLRSLVDIHPSDATKVLGGLRDRGFLDMTGWARGTRYELTGPALGPAIGETEISDDLSTDIGESGKGMGESRSSIGDFPKQLQDIARPAQERQWLSARELDVIIVGLCGTAALSVRELATLLNRDPDYVGTRVRKLRRSERLAYTIPDVPRHPQQRYRATESPKESKL